MEKIKALKDKHIPKNKKEEQQAVIIFFQNA